MSFGLNTKNRNLDKSRNSYLIAGSNLNKQQIRIISYFVLIFCFFLFSNIWFFWKCTIFLFCTILCFHLVQIFDNSTGNNSHTQYGKTYWMWYKLFLTRKFSKSKAVNKGAKKELYIK